MNKKYNCETCKYRTDNKYDFNRHKRTKKHQCREQEIVSIKKYDSGIKKYEREKCKHCGKKISKPNMNKHMKICKKNIYLKEKKTKDKMIKYLMSELKNKEKNEETIKELKNELRDVEKEYMNFMKQVSKHGKNITKIGSVNMYFVIQNYDKASNYKDIMNKPFTESEIAGVERYGGVQGCFDIIYGRCIEGIEVKNRPFHCVDDSRNKYLLRIKDKWKIDKKAEKILEEIYPRIVRICAPKPIKSDKEIDGWKRQNARMNELANGRNKIIKLLNKETLLKNTVVIKEK